MSFHLKLRNILPLICAALTLWPGFAAHADDIDLFTGTSAGSSDYPNVLIILDNSSNWSAANQGWPTDTTPPVPCGNDCNKQGYYELKAIRSVVNALPTDALGDVTINLGLMMFNNSTASRDGAYVRYHVRQLTAANKASFTAKLDQIIQNFNTETAAASVQYEAALWDAFKYFGGFTNPDNANKDQAPPSNPVFNDGVPVFSTQFWGSNNADGTKPDGAAYSGANFVPVSTTSCGKNFIIFIGNGFPASSTTNGGANDMEHVLELLTNPASPPSSITQFPLSTYTYACNGAWSNASGYSCGTSAACTTSLAGLTNSAAKIYRCDRSDCGGASRRVQQCTAVTTTVTQQMPSGNAQGRFADEFTNFLYKTDVSNLTGQQNIVTYTVNVYKDQPSDDQTALMYNMATKAGGKAFNATNEQALINALKEIFIEIQSVNSTFASASLPINATNRSVNENQVFIGMFRPDSAASPRWFGNVKRYQLIFDQAGNLELADLNGLSAINTTTGFIGDCVTSWWTTDSPNPPGKADNSGYWSAYDIQPSPAGRCLTSSFNQFSDSPDGPRVEKGAVAEVIRKGNNPAVTDAAPTWVENRILYTASGTTLGEFNATNVSLTSYDSGTSTNERRVSWMRGQDTEDENGNGDLGSQSPAFANMLKETRASLHGDVVHSRPLPVTYSNKTVVFYGANDGSLRAIEASNGQELWAFIAPEFNSKLDRLRTQSPKVCYPNMLGMTYDASGACTAGSPVPTKRDFFFDGSIGLYQPVGETAWIFPTMRRGGRMIYALNVSNGATTPSIKWKFGCANLDSDASCSAGASGIGQTWSLPNVAFIKGYSTSQPVLTVGGGYDACEDANTASPSCASPKGNLIYVIDADSGSVIKSFATHRSVASDVSYIDMDFDQRPDYAYVADTGGNLYRINFVTYSSLTNTYTSLPPASWTITRVAYTTGGGRKFLFAPAVFGVGGKIYVALGSGDREHPLQSHYPYTSSITNRFYVYRDCLPDGAVGENIAGGDNLDDTTIMNMSSATSPPSCEANKTLTNNCSTNKGWFMNLDNGTGEQTVTSALISGGMVTFSTNRPIPPAAGSCATALGEARGYWLDLYNGSGAIGVAGSCGGLASAAFISGGLPPSPVTGTIMIGGKPTSVIIGAIKKSGEASSPISPQKATATNLPARKRVYSIIKGEN